MTAQINPALLKLARESRGWTQSDLAQRSGISQGAISKYEKAMITPSAEQVEALAGALGFATSFFANSEVRPASVMYRTRTLRSAKLEGHVRARMNLGRLVAARLLEDMEIDTVARFPDPDHVFETTEDAASFLRSAWWLAPGPIDNVSDAIEAAGGIVVRLDLGTDQAIAAYMHPLSDPHRWFFVNTRVVAGDRVRFSLAHELGHAVMHEQQLAPDTKVAENESNSFAGAFMMPADELLRDLPRGRLTLDHLADLKRRWGISMQAIAMRAQQIGAISRDELTRIFREISYRGYRVREPGHVEVERPGLLDGALEILRSEHGLDDVALAEMTGVELAVLQDLLPEHFVRRTGGLRLVDLRE